HWVVWIHSGPYVGWYPCYPSFIYIDYYSPVVYERWIIVDAAQISSGKYQHNAIPQDKRAQIFGSSSGVHKYIPREDDNSYHNYGPPKPEIEKYSGRKIEPIKTDFTSRPLNMFNLTEKRYQVYKPDFKTQIGDIGKLRDTNFNKQILSPQGVKNPIPSIKSDMAPVPKYKYPLGNMSFERTQKEVLPYNLDAQKFNPQSSGTGIYQNPKGGINYNNTMNSNPEGRILKEEAVKSYSPSGGMKGIYLPNSSSSDDDSDDNVFKKGVPKFSPKGSTVPKSVPQIKGK
ncbi:MAG: hypothetical protein N3B13_10630, partial [Deltaproteobacteria bacterium]|nr:hypothetical protein [Deltaproteobacteria bacterium]